MSDAAFETIRALAIGALPLIGVWLGNRNGSRSLDRQFQHENDRLELQERRAACSDLNTAAVKWSTWVLSTVHLHELRMNGTPITDEHFSEANAQLNDAFQEMHRAFSHLVLVCSDELLDVLGPKYVDPRNRVQTDLVALTINVNQVTVAALRESTTTFTDSLGSLLDDFRREARSTSDD